MININNITISFGDRQIFQKIKWFISDKSRIGLVGDNGQGKTTLLRAIMGQVEPDEGSIELADRKTIGYLPQDVVEIDPLHLMEYFKKKCGISLLEDTLNHYENLLAHCSGESDEFRKILTAYEEASAQYHAKNGYSFEANVKQVLKGFGFKNSDYIKRCTDFSGGWKMRILLAFIIISNPDIMLLDEPTNHLDTESMEWLENHLKEYQGTLIAISHDRTFLDKLVRQIAEVEQGTIRLYSGNYTNYLKEKEKSLSVLKKEMELQRSEIKKINAFVERFRYKATKAKQVQSRIKMLEKYDLIRKNDKIKTVAIKFPPCTKSGREVIYAKNVSKTYGNTEVFSNLNFHVYRGQRIALVGINGAGKTTLMRILSSAESPTSGEISYGLNIKMAFFSQESDENLDYEKTIWEEINSTAHKGTVVEKRNLLGAFLFSGDDIHKQIGVLSGGEKSRLALLKVMLHEANLIILDEPTNHLDIKTKDIFQEALLGYQGTVIIVSHDRYFLDRLIDRVMEIRQGRLHEYNGNYSYFIEKRREETMPACDASDNVRTTKIDDINIGKRHRETDAKKILIRKRNQLIKKISLVEERVELQEKEKGEIEQKLCDFSICRNPEKIKALNKELDTITSELEESYEIWHNLAEEMESLESLESTHLTEAIQIHAIDDGFISRTKNKGKAAGEE